LHGRLIEELSQWQSATFTLLRPLPLLAAGECCTVHASASPIEVDHSRSLFGFDISSQSAILGTWQYNCYFNQGPPAADKSLCSGPTSSVQGGITASMPGGSWVGAIASGWLSDILERKESIMIGSVIW